MRDVESLNDTKLKALVLAYGKGIAGNYFISIVLAAVAPILLFFFAISGKKGPISGEDAAIISGCLIPLLIGFLTFLHTAAPHILWEYISRLSRDGSDFPLSQSDLKQNPTFSILRKVSTLVVTLSGVVYFLLICIRMLILQSAAA